MFYFAGHGIFYQRDYIMPVDVPKDDEYMLDDLVGVNEIVQRIQNSTNNEEGGVGGPKLFLFLLDTCRLTPGRDLVRRGVDLDCWPPVASMDTRRNMVMGYATSENRNAYEVYLFRYLSLKIIPVNWFFFSYNQSQKLLATDSSWPT